MTGQDVELRWDEAEEMAIMEAAGIVRGSDDWHAYLSAYRGTLRWHWITAGGIPQQLMTLLEPGFRRVFRDTMGYELPR